MTADQEADLFSVWLKRAVLRRWLMLLGFASTAGAIMFTYGLLRAPLYTSSWLMSIGRVAELGPIETARVAAARLEAWLQDEPRAQSCSWRTSYVPEPEVTVALFASCRTPEEATRLAQVAGEQLLARHNEIFEEWSESTKAYVGFLKAEIEKLEKAAMPASPELTLLRIWLKRDLQSQLFETNDKVVGVQTHPSEIVVRSAAAGPTRQLGMLTLLGVVLGIVLGLIASLVREIRREAVAQATRA